MPTIMTGRAETRSISIAATPDSVLELVGDARRLPDWAPAFAQAVERDGDDWLVDSGGGRLRIRVRVGAGHGTVDLVGPQDPSRGAHMRVLPNEQGSELLFTLVFPGGTAPEAVAEQMATVEGELETVRALCETGAQDPAGRLV
jgi:hypothetical protein